MKKLLIIVFLLCLLTACGSNGEKITTQAEATADTEATEASEGIATAVVEKEYSMNFDGTTNNALNFQNIIIQVPDNWYIHQQDEEFIRWLPEYDSEEEYAQIYLIIMGRWGYSQESIHTEELQSKIQDAVADRFLDGITNVEKIESSIGKANTEYYLYSLEGIHQTDSQMITIKVSTYSFVVNDKLYMLLYQSSSEDSFDYTLDVISTIGSVAEYTESLSIENTTVIETTEAQYEPEETHEKISDSQIADIKVRFIVDTIDNDRLHLKVYTKNTSEEIFSGNVHVYFSKRDGKEQLGSDTIFVESLFPGQECWANVIVDAYNGTPKMDVEFTTVNFLPLEQITAKIDQEVSKKVKRSFELNFEGVSWYNDIIKIEVYTDGNCVVTIADNTKEDGQFYANVILQCGEQYCVDTVRVVDASGNIKAVY